MAIEDAIKDLTAALKENTDVLNKMIAKARQAVSANSPSSDKETKETKKASEEAPSGRRGRPSAGQTKERSSSGKSVSVSDMKEKASAFLDAAADEDEYKARRAIVAKIVESYGVDRFTAISPEDRASALEALAEGAKKLSEESPAEEDEDLV